jgi:hypothetical protein
MTEGNDGVDPVDDGASTGDSTPPADAPHGVSGRDDSRQAQPGDKDDQGKGDQGKDDRDRGKGDNDARGDADSHASDSDRRHSSQGGSQAPGSANGDLADGAVVKGSGSGRDVESVTPEFSDEELDAAMAGFEKEFDESEAGGAESPGVEQTRGKDGSGAADSGGLRSPEPERPSFDDELQGLLGNKAKVAIVITRLASARLLAAFCQLSDISADCFAADQGAAAVLRNLDGDAPEAAARDLTTVVSGMSVVLAVNRADKLQATVYVQGNAGQEIAPPILFTSTPSFVEDMLLGISTTEMLHRQGLTSIDSADLDQGQAMSIIAEHTRFGRGDSHIE